MQGKFTTSNSNILVALSTYFARSVKMMTVAMLVGGLIGYALYHVYQPRWTAKMVVKLGQITTFTDSGSVIRPLELQMGAVDRINQPAYRVKVLKALGFSGPEDRNSNALLIFNSLLAMPGRSPDLLTVQVNGHSPELAEKALLASFALMQGESQKTYNDMVSRMKKELADIEVKLALAQQEYARVYDALKGARGQDITARDLLMSNVIVMASRQIVDLQKRKAQLQDSLEPIRTYPTSMVDAPYASSRPTSPGLPMFLGLGVVVGGIVGTLLFVLIRIRQHSLHLSPL